MNSFKTTFVSFIKALQDQLCSVVELEDGHASFVEELWTREGGGGGRTRIISEGAVFEKGGINISEVFGKLPASMMDYLNVENDDFFACGLSLVLHPHNPFVPTIHANFRYFELYDTDGKVIDHWFGGGTDLTPYYLFEEDALHFHTVEKDTCDKFDKAYYPKYKKACDDYFFNHHRDEARGIGGLFYDHLRAKDNMSPSHWCDFVMANGKAFLEAYIPIVQKKKKYSFYRRS